MTTLSTVLILTYPEHGQANVNLAISYELALAGVNVYVASFASLGPRVSRLQELIHRHALRSGGTPTGSVTFRECKGVTPNWEAQAKCGIHDGNLPHPCGVLGAVKGYSKMDCSLFFWSQEEYLAAITSVRDIIATVKPDIVGVDPLFFAAQDACKLADEKFVILSPLGLKEVVVGVQPYFAELWKYPGLASGFSFPLKWWQIPTNIYLRVRFIMYFVLSAKVKQTFALRTSLGLGELYGLRPLPDIKYICPALAEIDFPFSHIPKNILTCGPILMPFDPLEESDPKLLKWLDNGPTVLINLGSHVVSDGTLAREMVTAFRILLDHHDKRGSSRIQVLWKVKAVGDIQKVIDDVVGEEVKAGRVKVVAWLDAEPISILQHPNVVCTVHHGGANSFYEGVWSGVPHIVLPVWFDTYDFAQRAEFLKIGIFGNKTCAPGVQANELGNALVKVTGESKEVVQLRTSAKHLKEVCRARGIGRKLACAAILKESGSRG